MVWPVRRTPKTVPARARSTRSRTHRQRLRGLPKQHRSRRFSILPAASANRHPGYRFSRSSPASLSGGCFHWQSGQSPVLKPCPWLPPRTEPVLQLSHGIFKGLWRACFRLVRFLPPGGVVKLGPGHYRVKAEPVTTAAGKLGLPAQPGILTDVMQLGQAQAVHIAQFG